MTDPIIEQLLKNFKLNEDQRQAALDRGRDVVVTAGAGSGKTLTLVARYVCLMAEGISPRRIAAITFTKKAAREMRSRVRIKLMELQEIAETEEERQKWMELSAQMDSARIGTIHSLCTEILRAHPAEAGVDPRFEVLDEGMAAALRIQAVDDTLKGLVEQEKFIPLLQNISVNNLTEMLQNLLERRLQAGEIFEIAVDNRARISKELRERMEVPLIAEIINKLRGMANGELLTDTARELLQLWTTAEHALADGNPVGCAINLYKARNLMKGARKNGGMVQERIATLRENYDILLNPLTGGKKPDDPSPSPEAEALFEQLLPLLREAFDSIHQAYKELVQDRRGLDFDDLEYGALQLLRREEIRSHWQGELDAVLVDEFQDTNQRQREIAEALAGAAGRLIIVGDRRQSIYRFRQADVTVFGEVQDRIQREGGLVIDLNKTYRAHEPLLLATGDLLEAVINTREDRTSKYFIAYTPLVANEKNPPEGIKAPHIEVVIGAGEDSETARPVAARALAERLHQLKEEEQIKKWDEVALLFRAATGFPFYEEALEDAGIPFVTVAGRGFYDRPEIRDLVNILRALADPMDDLSFAGLLRSPAFGLSDAALFLLRQTGQPFWTALNGDLSTLSERDQQCAERTQRIITSLLPVVDRVPVAELLKQVVDAVDYRAMLATIDMKKGEQDASAAEGRLWRNLDKLLEDAQVSQQVSVRDFLDLLTTLNDAGAREGEAPAEAEGAVRLMTIHKAKGLEFPVVVLADASRQMKSASEQAYLSDDLGVTIKLDQAPMLYKLAKIMDKDQDECEELRVLYVAMTRAKTKLLISGHAKPDAKGNIKLAAWANKLDAAAGNPSQKYADAEGKPFEVQTGSNQPLRVWCLLEDTPTLQANRSAARKDGATNSDLPPLYKPILDEKVAAKEREEEIIDPHAWRATRGDKHVPGNVLGNMVHKAIQRWRFPGDPALEQLLRTQAQMEGLYDEHLLRQAIQLAEVLLERFQQHPLYNEMNTALERQHEVPFTGVSVQGNTEWGLMDCLYRTEVGWTLVDFKTDDLWNRQALKDAVDIYTPQIIRYRRAMEKWMEIAPRTLIFFLNLEGKIEVIEVK